MSEHRVLGIYYSNTSQHNKDVILQSLLDPNRVVRVVLTTITQGIGVNLRDINSIMHYMVPLTVLMIISRKVVQGMGVNLC